MCVCMCVWVIKYIYIKMQSSIYIYIYICVTPLYIKPLVAHRSTPHPPGVPKRFNRIFQNHLVLQRPRYP